MSKEEAPKRTKIDWEAVEIDYRAGVKTLRTMAAQHGCAESAIRKKAKDFDWQRDLAAKVRQKADEKVRKAEVRKVLRTETTQSEKQQIEVMAEVESTVILNQRNDIKRGRTLAMSLLEELEGQTVNIADFEKLGALMYQPDDKGRDKLNDTYMKVISSAGRIDSMKKLADTMKTLVALEREAYGINAEHDKPGGYEDDLGDL